MMGKEICQSCKKNVATWTVTYPGAHKDVHLCDECARAKGLVSFPPPFSLADIIGSLLTQTAKKEQSKLAKVKCTRCGLSYADFRTTGRLGCAHDYVVFADGLIPLLEKIQGTVHHVGKAPASAAGEVAQRNKLYQLRRQLHAAVKSEKYEEAATLRDHIRALEEKLGENQ